MRLKHRICSPTGLLLSATCSMFVSLVGYYMMPRTIFIAERENARTTHIARRENPRTLSIAGGGENHIDNVLVENPDCSGVTRHILKRRVTGVSFKNSFGGCANAKNANAKNASRDEFTAVFGIRTFRDVVCEPRNISFLTKARPKIVLASFPGSGNTWTRHLLEQVTGIWTGSVYGIGDTEVEKIFLGEGLCPNSHKTFILKSHVWNTRVASIKIPCAEPEVEDEPQNFAGEILILRDPYETLLSEFNRQHGSHTGVADRSLLLDNTTVWRNFINVQAVRWRKHATNWITRYDGPVHVLFYENLKTSLAYELYRIMVFLKQPITYKALWCAMSEPNGQFKRKKPEWLENAKVFTEDMQILINEQIAGVESVLRDNNVTHNRRYRYKNMK